MKEFLIPFVGLKLGKHHFEYQIDNTFFQEFEYQSFEDASVKVEVILEKKATLLEFYFNHSGWVTVPCDLTNELYDQEISGSIKLIVKFGEVYNDDNEELLVLPYDEYQLNVAQYIYESIVLSVPVKRVHPGILDESINTEAYERYVVYELPEEDQPEKEIDPRWVKLKELLKDKQ